MESGPRTDGAALASHKTVTRETPGNDSAKNSSRFAGSSVVMEAWVSPTPCQVNYVSWGLCESRDN